MNRKPKFSIGLGYLIKPTKPTMNPPKENRSHIYLSGNEETESTVEEADMEIIQASVHVHPWRHHQFTPISAKPQLLNPHFFVNNPIFSVKPKNYKLVSSSKTRAILESSTSDLVAATEEKSDQLLAIKKRASEISSDLKGTSIFLVGINCSYKSNLGRILADALRYYYFDSDSLVEEAAGGKTNALPYIESDEQGYLNSETEVLKQLSSMGRLIVCTGNGAVKSAENLALLRHGISIWIDVPLDLVAGEIIEDKIQLSASDASQCKSSSEVLDQVTALYVSARSGYTTADATISVQKVASELGYDELDAVTTEELCLEVFKEVERLTRVKKMMEEAARPF